jgi:hypothetical protein
MNEKNQNDLDKDPDNFNSEEIAVKNLFYNDSTSLMEISQNHNDNFSSGILREAKKNYDIDKVRDLKKPEKKEKFLKEIERQSKCLEKARQEISIHSAKFECILLYQQGVLLKEAEEFFKPKKKSFIKWRKKTFPNQHLRTLQQAQKLAKIGPKVLEYSAMGKARILSLDALLKNIGIDFEGLVKKYPFPDLSKDENGNEFFEHADAIITLYRIRGSKQEAGIKGLSFVTFEQAQLIAAIKKEAIKVMDADRLKKETAKANDQKAFFERYLLNKAVLSNEATKKTEPSLDSLLAKFLNSCTDKNIEDQQWVESHKDSFNKDNIVAAYNRIKSIAGKFNIDLEESQQSTVTKEDI